MRQQTFTDIEYSGRKRKTKRETFLQVMKDIIPWEEWIALIRPFYPIGKRGRPPMGSRKCCGCICCNRGSTSRTKVSKMRSNDSLCHADVHGSQLLRGASAGCNYAAAFSAFARREPSRRSHVCGDQRRAGSKRLHHARWNDSRCNHNQRPLLDEKQREGKRSRDAPNHERE